MEDLDWPAGVLQPPAPSSSVAAGWYTMRRTGSQTQGRTERVPVIEPGESHGQAKVREEENQKGREEEVGGAAPQACGRVVPEGGCAQSAARSHHAHRAREREPARDPGMVPEGARLEV